jgi:hypothetical protein
MNLCIPEGWVVPAPLVAYFAILLTTRTLSIEVVLDTSIRKLIQITSIKHETPPSKQIRVGEKAEPNIVFTPNITIRK